MTKRRAVRGLVIGVLLAAVLASAWLYQETRPTDTAGRTYVRFTTQTDYHGALDRLHAEGLIRSTSATYFVAWFRHEVHSVEPGIYRFEAGRGASGRIVELRGPVHQRLRLPETNWALRTANVLEKHDVCTADEYMEFVRNPDRIRSEVSFPIESTTLEGYLYPATYDLPPTLGAHDVILTQLKRFETEVWEPLGHPKDLLRLLKEASLVELEVKYDNERPMVAGVIENRLKLGSPLQIDASINYGMQIWRPLKVSEYHSFQSEYNLYLHKGLPPTPICSPSAKSVDAAVHPANHKYLFYVALPGGVSLFAENYAQHLKNVKKRRDAIKALRGAKR